MNLYLYLSLLKCDDDLQCMNKKIARKLREIARSLERYGDAITLEITYTELEGILDAISPLMD